MNGVLVYFFALLTLNQAGMSRANSVNFRLNLLQCTLDRSTLHSAVQRTSLGPISELSSMTLVNPVL